MRLPLVPLGCVCAFLAPATTPAAAQSTAPASPEEIARLVAGLANRSYSKREEAARRIAQVGPAAIPYLRREIDNPRQEIALAARELMEELQDVFFCGVTVRLEVDPPRTQWDRPVRLRIVTENRSPFDAKLPWDIAAAATRPASLAERVGLMLAVGDFLEVTSPTGQPVDLRIESIDDDLAVQKTVNDLATGGPVSVLAPGQQCVADLPEFNRGWARYPLLAKGRYRVRFAYQPQWSRPEWIEAGVGRVVGNTVDIEVTDAAPPMIRKGTQPVRLLLSRQSGDFVVRVQSTWDRPVCVNLNFGPEGGGFAQLDWCLRPKPKGKDPVRLPAFPTTVPTLPVPTRIRQLQPGEELTIAQTPASSLRAAVEKQLPAEPRDALVVSVIYANQATREDLRRIGEKTKHPAGAALRTWAEQTVYPVVTGAPASRSLPLAKGAAASRPGAARRR